MLASENEQGLLNYFHDKDSMSYMEAILVFRALCDYVESESALEFDRQGLERGYQPSLNGLKREQPLVTCGALWGTASNDTAGVEADSEWRVNADMVIGGVEIFAGALLAILPNPWTRKVAVSLAGDGPC